MRLFFYLNYEKDYLINKIKDKLIVYLKTTLNNNEMKFVILNEFKIYVIRINNITYYSRTKRKKDRLLEIQYISFN